MGDKGEWWRGWILNVTLYPQHNGNKKILNEEKIKPLGNWLQFIYSSGFLKVRFLGLIQLHFSQSLRHIVLLNQDK
jgi:hypothetical protein